MKDVREQRCKMRNREKTWKNMVKSISDLSYKIERNNFNSCLRKAKRDTLSEKLLTPKLALNSYTN